MRTSLRTVAMLAAGFAVSGAAPAAHASTIGGEARVESFVQPDDRAAGRATETFFDLRLDARARLGSALSLEVDARAVADDAELTAGAYDPTDRAGRRAHLSISTAALVYRPLEGVRLSAGRQILDWSSIDELEPANLLAPSDRSDVFRDEKTGVYALGLRAEGSKIFAELAVVPLLFPTGVAPRGRWSLVPDGVAERRDLPRAALDETQAGLRLGLRTGGLDATLQGYAGRDFLPEFALDAATTAARPAVVALYPRVRSAALLLSAPVGEAALAKSEIVFFSSPGSHRDDFLQTAVGLEASLGDWHADAGYLRDDRVRRAKLDPVDEGERRFFRSFLFGELRRDPGGRVALRLRGGYDVTGRFLVIEPEAAIDLGLGSVLTLSANVIQATRPTYFSRIRHEDRIGVRLSRRFDVCGLLPGELQSPLGCSR